MGENDYDKSIDAWKIAEYDTLRKLAIAYRAAQRKYFKTRSATDLRVAKDYERRLDDELKRPAGAPPPPRQPWLL